MPGGSLHLFGVFIGDTQIGFQCFANYVPHRKGTVKQWHSNRTVIHPDYNGLGLGIKVINATSQWMRENVPNIKIMAKFSSTPVYKAMIKQSCWRFLGEKRLMGKMKYGDNVGRNGGFREGGVRTFHFEFTGVKDT